MTGSQACHQNIQATNLDIILTQRCLLGWKGFHICRCLVVEKLNLLVNFIFVWTLVTTSQVSGYHIFETSWRYYQMCTKLHPDYYSILSCIVTRRVSIFSASGLWREITTAVSHEMIPQTFFRSPWFDVCVFDVYMIWCLLFLGWYLAEKRAQQSQTLCKLFKSTTFRIVVPSFREDSRRSYHPRKSQQWFFENILIHIWEL